MPATERNFQSSFSLLFGIWRHLSRERKIQLGLLLMVMFLSSAAEVVSLGAVIPFLAIISDPNKLSDWPVINNSRIFIFLVKKAISYCSSPLFL